MLSSCVPLAAFVLLVVTVATPAPVPEQPPSRVKALFDQMRDGKYQREGFDFPKLEWADIPELLAKADSTRLLEAFPRNPISSQYERACPEGVVALWLVEGLRKGGKYPSLNARLTTAAGEAKGEAFEENNKAA